MTLTMKSKAEVWETYKERLRDNNPFRPKKFTNGKILQKKGVKTATS